MGLTLIEAAKYEHRLEHLAVIKTFTEGELLARLPFMNISGGGLFYNVEKELPSSGFRAVNESHRQTYGVVDPQSEAVHLFGGDVDVDRSIVDLQGPEARASQVEMKVRSMRLTLEAALINGDPIASQGRGFEGLARRIPTSSPMAVDNGGAPLDFKKLDELIDEVNSYGGPKFLVMSKAMRRQFNAQARSTAGQALYNVTTNALGAMVHMYQDLMILTVDRDAQGLQVLGFGEAGSTSSIYCCTFGDQAVTGLQGPFQGRYGISVRDLGEVPDAPVFRTRIDWYCGFGVMNPRAAGRLYNIAALP